MRRFSSQIRATWSTGEKTQLDFIMLCPEIIYDFSLFRQLLQEAKLELKKSKRKDFYKILGVEKTANDDEIKKAYRKRAMVHHPDRHSSASDEEKKDHETKFKEVRYKQI